MKPSRDSWILAGLLAVLAAAVYLTYSLAIFAHFNYDDIPLIVENQYLRTWSGIFDLLKAGRPVRAVSFWVDYRLWGLDAKMFHFTNILLHMACVLAAFFLVRSMLESRRLAFISALIFAVTPVNSEAVIGIAHRKEMLCFLFMALSLLAFKSWKSGWAMPVLSLAFYAMALLSKQVAIALPLLLLFEGLVLRRPDRPARKRLLIFSAVLMAAPGLAFALSFSDFKLVGRFQSTLFSSQDYLQVLATQFAYFPKYLRLVFLPVHLSVDHNVEPVTGFENARAAIGLGLFAGCAGLALGLGRKQRPAALACGWFFLNMLPVLNFVPGNAILAERYLYIPSLGAAMLIAVLLEKLGQASKDLLASARLRSAALWLCNFAFMGFFFGWVIYQIRNLVWRELEARAGGAVPLGDLAPVFIVGAACAAALTALAAALWDRRKEQRPSGWFAEFGFFYLMLMLGLAATAVVIGAIAFHRPLPAFEIETNYQLFLGWLHMQARPDAAHVEGRLPHGTNPAELLNFFFYVIAPVAFLLALVNRKARQYAVQKSPLAAIWLLAPLLIFLLHNGTRAREAQWGSEVSLWQATVAENPYSFAGWNNLGRAYVDRKKFQDAVNCFIQAHSARPYALEPLLNLGNVMVMRGRLDDAAHYYNWALKFNPYAFTARYNLGNYYAAKKEFNRAVEQYLIALEIRPASFEANYGLALSFYAMGDRAKCYFYLQRALSIAPSHVPSRTLLRQLMSEPR